MHKDYSWTKKRNCEKLGLLKLIVSLLLACVQTSPVSLPPAKKGHMHNGIASSVPVSCFSGIHGILAVLGVKFRVNYIHVNRELMLYGEQEQIIQKKWLLKRSRYFHITLSLRNRSYWAKRVIISELPTRSLLFAWLRKNNSLDPIIPVMRVYS